MNNILITAVLAVAASTGSSIAQSIDKNAGDSIVGKAASRSPVGSHIPGHVGLGQEYIPAGEDIQIDKIVALQRDVQEKTDRKKSPVPRGQHPKQHGLVRAQFIIEPNLPAKYRHGIFIKPQTFQALIRFSNGRSQDDNKPDSHGMAIKLLGVAGEKVLATEKGAQTQDFLLIDHPIFFVKNVNDYVPLMITFDRLATGNFISQSLAGLQMLLSPDYKYRILRAAVSKQPASPLQIQYWGTTPSKMGSGAMKFSVRPNLADAPTPHKSNSKDKLRLAMSSQLKHHDAVFDFLVQLQTDPVAMPVEDPTIPWDETTAPFTKVASIRIPIQSFESKRQMDFGENLSFTPWHSLADLRPLGGINRTRKKVYSAISVRRHELNGVVMHEPTSSDISRLTGSLH